MIFGLTIMLCGILTIPSAVAQYGSKVLQQRVTHAIERRQFSVAVQTARVALNMDSQRGPLWFFLGQALLGDGKPDQAIEALLEARPRFAYLPSTERLLGQAHLQRNEFNLAAEAFARSLALAPTPPAEPLVRRQKSLALYQAGRHGESLHAQFQAMWRDPSAETELSIMRLNSATFTDLTQMAILTLRSSLASDPPRQPSVEQLSELIRRGEQFQRLSSVVAVLEMASQLRGIDLTRTLLALAAAQNRSGDLEAAIGSSERAARQDPTNPEPLLLFLDLLRSSDRPDRARIRSYGETFLRTFPDHPEAPDIRKILTEL
jgi:tetratricopeptide (TPR) repeat protein